MPIAWRSRRRTIRLWCRPNNRRSSKRRRKVGPRRSATWRPGLDGNCALLALRLQFEPRLIFFEERAQIFGSVEQANPLFVIECDREAAEAVDADASLFADAKFEAALGTASGLLFKLGNAREQFFFCWFSHVRLPPLYAIRQMIPLT